MTSEQVYQHVINRCKLKFIPREQKFVVFMTIACYDHSAWGTTARVAKHNLAYYLCQRQHVRDFLSKYQNSSK
jgi:hypothetical protein